MLCDNEFGEKVVKYLVVMDICGVGKVQMFVEDADNADIAADIAIETICSTKPNDIEIIKSELSL